jgi:hypothetical protein
MSKRGRTLKVGDMATTFFRGGARAVRVQITAVRHEVSQSGIQFQTKPEVSSPGAFIDADWFEPLAKQGEL